MQENVGKMGTRITPNTDFFYAVIGFFFKSKTPKASPATVSAQTEIKLPSSAAASSSTITTPTVNAHVTIENRERFLNENENDILKKFITELKVSFEQLFTDDVRNDQSIMGFLKIFLYKWEVFKVLQDQYEGSQTRDNWKSGLKRNLGEIDEEIIKMKKLFSEICDISNQIRGLVGSTFQLSQSYLKKSETLMNSLTSLQFVIFKPLSFSFEEPIGFDVKASFASRPVPRLIN